MSAPATSEPSETRRLAGSGSATDAEQAHWSDADPNATRRYAGRYTELDELGAGGMSVVYRAHDSDLGREVALKLLHHRNSDPNGEGRARFIREAQAMAQLNHPNVLPIYDVTVERGEVVIVMEYVDGMDLRRWLKARRRWRDVLDVFCRAGRGLAAAHAAGVVHRDFKPANVMLGKDGRVRVMDFGLARIAGTRSSAPRSNESGSDDANSPGSTAEITGPLSTQTGVAMGTPAYMAPEQHCGERVTEQSDQYSFCVALYEGLFGKRPPILKPVTTAPAVDPPIPRAVFAAVQRGLHHSPHQRWPSMDALLAALAVPRRRWRAWTFGAGLATAGLMVIAAWPSAPTTPCERAQIELANAFDDARANAIASSFEATSLPYARQAAHGVQEDLELHVSAWTGALAEICGPPTPAAVAPRTHDLQMSCLRDHASTFDAAVDVLTNADPSVVDNANALVAGLGDPAACTDAAYVTARIKPPDDPVKAARVEKIRQELDAARTLRTAGHAEDALLLVQAVRRPIEDLQHPPLRAEADLVLGGVYRSLERHEASAEHFRDAFFTAHELDLVEVSAKAATGLTQTVGVVLARPAQGRTWARHAQAAHERLADARAQAVFLEVLGNLARVEANYDDALGKYAEAAQRWEALVGPDGAELASCHHNTALALQDRGNYIDARTHFDRAIEIWERTHGTDHPDTIGAREAIAENLWKQGKADEAIEMAEALLARAVLALGKDHVVVASIHNNLGATLPAMQRHEEALEHLVHALAIYERVYGEQHPAVAVILSNMGALAAGRGDYDAALEHLGRMLTIKESYLGPDHPQLAPGLNNLAITLYASGRVDEAKDQFERALAINEEAFGNDHPEVAIATNNIANLLLSEKRYTEALPYALRAKETWERLQDRGLRYVETVEVLAGIYEQLGEDARAAELHAQAEKLR